MSKKLDQTPVRGTVNSSTAKKLLEMLQPKKQPQKTQNGFDARRLIVGPDASRKLFLAHERGESIHVPTSHQAA